MSEKGKYRGKKRPKSYYKKCANIKRIKLNQLDSGVKGFIITCNDREKEATKETFNLLNEYADQLYGPEKLYADAKSDNDNSDDDDEDIEKAMKKEVEAFKKTKSAERRFQRLDSKAKNCIFIKTTLDNPSELAEKVFDNLLETKVQKTRYAIRLLPVEGTCKAVLDDILKLGSNLFEKYFATPLGEGLSFSIVFKARNNSTIARDNVIPPLSHIVTEINPAHTVEHNNPHYLITVHIMCTVCCISVLKNFFKFKKYNLLEVVKEQEIKVKADFKNAEAEVTERKESDKEKLDESKNCEASDNISQIENQNKNDDALKCEIVEQSKVIIDASSENVDINNEAANCIPTEPNQLLNE